MCCRNSLMREPPFPCLSTQNISFGEKGSTIVILPIFSSAETSFTAGVVMHCNDCMGSKCMFVK